MSQKKKVNKIQIKLVYKSSPEGNFRLFKALSVFLNENDILAYYQNQLKSEKYENEYKPKK